MAGLRNKQILYLIGWLLFANNMMTIVEDSISVGLLALEKVFLDLSETRECLRYILWSYCELTWRH